METPTTSNLGDQTPNQSATPTGVKTTTEIIKSPETGQSVGSKVYPNTVTMFEDIAEFHKKFGIEYGGPPRHPDEVPIMDFRMKRTAEEVRELYAAYHAKQADQFLDAHVDLIYILLGTIHLCGYDFNEAWRRVHAANMRKVRASKANPGKYGNKSDIVKPDGWVAPNLMELVNPSMKNLS